MTTLTDHSIPSSIRRRHYEDSKTGSHVNPSFGVPTAAVTETNLLEEKPKAVALGDSRS